MQILVTGGTGFIGKACVKFLLAQNHEVLVLTRSKHNAPEHSLAIEDLEEIEDYDKIDVIINLAGSRIDKRWSNGYKKILIDSRIDTTKNIISLIERLQKKPQLLISASAVGYYGSQGNTKLTESSPYLPNFKEFPHELCQKWEEEALKAKKLGVRVCIARIGPVLGRSGGMMQKILPSFRGGMGKKLGDGQQYVSWVHLFDVIHAFNFMITKSSCKGTYNVTSPNPVTNEEFTVTINNTLNLPTLFFIPSILIKIIYGEMGSVLLLKGQRATPKKLIDEGFKFKFNKLDEAIKQILDTNKVT